MQTKDRPTKSKIVRSGLIVLNGGNNSVKTNEGFYVSNYKENSSPDTIIGWNVGNDYYPPDKTSGSYELEENSLIVHNAGGGGGGNGMEKRIENLERKTEQIQTEISTISRVLSVIEERQNHFVSKSDLSDFENRLLAKINELPKNDNIKQLIIQANKEQDFATKTHVDSELKSLKLSSIKYLIGTGIAIVGAVCAAIKLFM